MTSPSALPIEHVEALRSAVRTGLPRISIAVPSFNHGRFISETLQSLVDQQYPNLEVIVQDGGSTDGAAEIAQEFAGRFPHVFRLYVEKDRGHAHALNMAFRKSTGSILGYLNTDDTLYPGCLHSVAREIDPSRGRYIVFGRCIFTGEGSPYVGREHPAEYHGHFDLLAAWRRGWNIIPQPSTFWHRKVYQTCGDFDERYNQGLDYLQWCKFSKRFNFHRVDELWSTPHAPRLRLGQQDRAGVARYHDSVQPNALGAVVAAPAMAVRAVVPVARSPAPRTCAAARTPSQARPRRTSVCLDGARGVQGDRAVAAVGVASGCLTDCAVWVLGSARQGAAAASARRRTNRTSRGWVDRPGVPSERG